MSENRLFLRGEENKYSSAVARGPRDRFNSKQEAQLSQRGRAMLRVCL